MKYRPLTPGTHIWLVPDEGALITVTLFCACSLWWTDHDSVLEELAQKSRDAAVNIHGQFLGWVSQWTHPPWLSQGQNTAPGLPELEHMFLLFVIDRYFADCVLQADGDLVVVGDARSSSFRVLVEAHLLVVYDTVHVMPWPLRHGKQQEHL